MPTPKEILDQMNKEIEALQVKRFDWIQENFMEFAEYSIGEMLYAKIAANEYRLQKAGKVTDIYLEKCYNKKDKLNMSYPDVVYKFEPVSSYHYGDTTGSHYATFYCEKQWKPLIEAKKRALEKELEG